MMKRYLKTICDDGKILTERKRQQVSSIHRGKRAGRTNKTSPEVAANNNRRRNVKYGQQLNYNFNKRDTVAVLSIDEDHYGSVSSNIWESIDRFIWRLKYVAQTNGVKVVMTMVLGRGKDGRLHVHALISKDVKREWIRSAWHYGRVLMKKAYLKHGSFQALGNYFLNNADECKDMGRKSAYRNIGMRQVPTVTEEISEEEMFSISKYDGYRQDRARSYYGTDDYGRAYAFATYQRIRKHKSDAVSMATTAGSDAGMKDGYVDGYNAYMAGAEDANAFLSMQMRCQLGCNICGKTEMELRASSEIYASTYCKYFEKGKHDAFISIIKTMAVTGYNQLYFASHNGRPFFLSEVYWYYYAGSTLYYLIDNLWIPLGIGRLYSVKNGYITHILPEGRYRTCAGANYINR